MTIITPREYLRRLLEVYGFGFLSGALLVLALLVLGGRL